MNILPFYNVACHSCLRQGRQHENAFVIFTLPKTYRQLSICIRRSGKANALPEKKRYYFSIRDSVLRLFISPLYADNSDAGVNELSSMISVLYAKRSLR